MQATVRSFSPQTQSGTVLLDDGLQLPFDQVAFGAGGLRLLRLGQRVRIRVTGDGARQRVTFLTLATLPEGPAQGSAQNQAQNQVRGGTPTPSSPPVS